MSTDSFVHLHNHTEYSMLDGAARVEDMVLAAKADGQTAIGITDHGNLYGVLEFYDTCRKHDVTPIIGLEAYMARNSRHDRPSRRGKVDDSGGEVDGGHRLYNHLTLLAESTQGYRNLIQLSSRAFLEGYYYKPRVDWELLEQHHEGLIATSSCLSGVVLEALVKDNFDEGLSMAARLQDIFGRDNFFIELQDHGIADQLRTNPSLIEIAKRLDAPLLATNDIHYVHRDDADMQDALLCVQTGSLMSDTNRFKFDSHENYLKTAAEMRYLFRELPDSCNNTLWIAERANVTISKDNDALPQFPIPPEYQKETEAESANNYLRELTYQGALARYADGLNQEVRDRIDYELGVIANMGFSDYFLVVWDLIRFAKESKIRVGPGRGSAAGCCVAYCLGIVELDPIKYGLIFERFLNPGRKQMPDIDMDFDERFRGEMIKYAAERYGSDHVAQIVTFSTIKARAAVRDAARVLGFPPAVGDKIAKAMPPLLMGKDVPLNACLVETPGFEDRFAEAADLRRMNETDPDVAKTISVALGLEGKRRQDGIHAAAVVITKEPVTEYVPIQRKPGPNGNIDDAPVVTQFEMHGVEDLGLLKMDFLGLKNLAIIERCLDLVEMNSGVRPDIDHVELDDPGVYSMLQRGASMGLFQLESPNMRDLMRRLSPTAFEDIAALVALYRPGPMGEKTHHEYADRKNGRKKVVYDHVDLEDVLGETYGLMVYQEDMMRVATKIAGYSMTEADNLRKATGKKIREMIQAERERFVSGADNMGYGRELGTLLFDKIEPFADYAFNKSHAYGYALLAYQNGYLKFHYPLEYMSAVLTSSKDDKDKLASYLSECRSMGIAVRVPDVNESLVDFAPSITQDRTINFGLSAVRNVGSALVDRIVTERREHGNFADVYDFVRRVDPLVLNKRTMESLAKGGAFDSLGISRQGLTLVVDELVDRTLERRKDITHGISTLFATLDDAGDWSGTDVPIPTKEFNKEDRLNFEREMLGLYVSDHPLLGVEKTLDLYSDYSINDLRASLDVDGSQVVTRIAGVLTSVVVKTSRSGSVFAQVTIEDLTSSANVMVFGKLYTEKSSILFKDNIVSLKVRAENRDDSPRMTALDVVAPKIKTIANDIVQLNLDGPLARPEGIARLKEILKKYPGSTEVFLHMPHSSQTYRIGAEFKINVADAAGELLTTFGGNVFRSTIPSEGVSEQS
ncbi:unannotated protein [freshwater metagenome]|uniref:DNA-directed DNA polymerase n=1 Tax=freshwater metagenome TaxID=449393 RepID=A0A6J7CUZ4_9ZZZZ|nr:DNA polymerase III subunit alpha [Actinomycetota bacterium]